MNPLTRRVDKLEEEHVPDAEAIRRDEELRAAIEAGRKRVLAAKPDFVFSDEPLEPARHGKFDLAAALERARQRAVQRLQAAC